MITFLAELAVRSTVLFAVALGATVVFRRQSASLRYLILAAAALAAAVMPAAMAILPSATIPIPIHLPEETPSRPSPGLIERLAVPTSTSTPAPLSPTSEEPFPWLMTLFLAGFIWQAARAFLGWQAMRGLRNRAADFSLPATLTGVCPIPVRISGEIPVPALSGCLRPVILLPAESANWPIEKLAMALCHETAHLHRRDHWGQIPLVIIRCIYWWNPLALLALKLLRRERENACDDRVLAAGHSSSDYAALLVEAARSHRAFPVLSMASPPIENRVRRALDPSVSRSPSRKLGMAALAILAALWGAACFISIRFQAETGARFTFPNFPQASPSGPNKQIEVSVTLIEISEEAYRRNPRLFDTAVAQSDRAGAERLLTQISGKAGVHLLSAPRVTLKPNSDATIQVVREFRYPTTFVQGIQGLTPTTFETINLGFDIPLSASLGDTGIQVKGTLNLRTFSGFTASERGAFTPAFQTAEAHFLRVLPNGGVCGLWVPGAQDISGQPERLQKMMVKLAKPGGNPVSTQGLYEPVAPVRLAMFLSVRLVGGAGRSPSIAHPEEWTHQWLEGCRIPAFRLKQATWRQAIDELRALLTARFPLKDQTLSITTDTPPLSQETADIELRDTTARAAINEITAKFGGAVSVLPFAVHFSAPQNRKTDMPYATAVPGKPGFFTSPHSPYAGYVDLRGFPSGTEVKCPYTSRAFLVP